MNKYSSDSTVIASAQNSVVSGETVWSPLLCGLYCTWRQKRLHEGAFYAALGYAGFIEYMERFKEENYKEERRGQ